jgi:hypothetical protein
MNTVTAWMDSTWYVEAYFAFGKLPAILWIWTWLNFSTPQGVTHNMVGVNPLDQLMASNGQPTELGWNYLT